MSSSHDASAPPSSSGQEEDQQAMTSEEENRKKRRAPSAAADHGNMDIDDDINDDAQTEKEIPASCESAVPLAAAARNGNETLDDESKLTKPNYFPEALAAVRRLRLEAIFHPKFENEKIKTQARGPQHDDDGVRAQMRRRVADGKGCLEVTLKHSGSLLLWSGGRRYYSKNATDNVFCHVGEILLRQHFVRSHWPEQQQDCTNAQVALLAEKEYRACSDYIEKHRLTLSFECVTSVLGDHGQKPRRDFCILTAVADRSRQRFYSTAEIVALAQQFRLPHNDAWLYHAADGVDALFRWFDANRETAGAVDACQALTASADVCVPSMYPHQDFQGDILEGVVIRYVSHRAKKSGRKESGGGGGLARMKQLAPASNDIVNRLVPPSRPDCFELVAPLRNQKQGRVPVHLGANIRAIYEASAIQRRSDGNGKRGNGSDSFPSKMMALLEEGEGTKRSIVRAPRSANIDIPSLVNPKSSGKGQGVGRLSESSDRETKRIATVIETLQRIRVRVDYSILREEIMSDAAELDDDGAAVTAAQRQRLLCIMHVVHDEAHQKYRRAMGAGDMALFRGFSIELDGEGGTSMNQSGEDQDGDAIMEMDSASADDDHEEEEEDEPPLMLKMKFLRYMVRTFGCRNGLSILRRDGPDGFCRYTNNLLSKWKMSQQAKNTWSPFFRAWAEYARPRLTESGSREDMPNLTDGNYLVHLEHFSEIYANSNKAKTASASTFRGLVVVVAVEKATADRVADEVAKALGGAKRLFDVNKIKNEDMALFCTSGGSVCSATPKNGTGSVRRLVPEYGEHLSLLLFGTSDVEVASAIGSSESELVLKQTLGVLKGWRKTRAALLLELPSASLFPSFQTSVDAEPEPAPTEEFQEAIKKLSKVSPALTLEDEVPGVLIFFPGIPGCGKSSLSGPEMEKELRQALSRNTNKRSLTVRMGDKTKGKYWPLVRKERTMDPTGVYIADKNLPATTWSLVAEICADTQTVAIPVVPDPSAFQTTTIQGNKKPNGTFDRGGMHVYPFSLHYLAVCMLRVSTRDQGSHPGKLDKATKRACMIVVKFFTLYGRISADEYMENMQSTFANAGAYMTFSPITVPFFAGEPAALPVDLEGLLVEALQVQRGYEMAKKDVCSFSDDALDDLEGRLRRSLQTHRDFVVGLTEDYQVSQASIISSLMDRIGEVDAGFYAQNESKSPDCFIKLAAIDVAVNTVHDFVRRILQGDGRFACLVKILAKEQSLEKVLIGEKCEDSRFIPRTHVTMAHFQECSQFRMQKMFGEIAGDAVEVFVTALLWNEKVAALEVDVPETTASGKELPASKNDFTHITLWHEKGTSAKTSNDLPSLVEAGQAERVAVDRAPLEGRVSLWTT